MAMKRTSMLVVCSALALIPAARAQRWEVGGAVGGGFYTSQDVSAPGGSASAKIQNSYAGTLWLGNNGSGHWGGELRADYQGGALQLNQGSTQASFGAHSYGLHYD